MDNKNETAFNQTEYVNEWKKKNVSRVVVEVKPAEKAAWKQAAEERQKSLQRFIRDTMNNEVNKK